MNYTTQNIHFFSIPGNYSSYTPTDCSTILTYNSPWLHPTTALFSHCFFSLLAAEAHGQNSENFNAENSEQLPRYFRKLHPEAILKCSGFLGSDNGRVSWLSFFGQCHWPPRCLGCLFCGTATVQWWRWLTNILGPFCFYSSGVKTIIQPLIN